MDAGPLPVTFRIEQEAPVEHRWNARRPRPTELTITEAGFEYTFAEGERHAISWEDPETRLLFRDWMNAQHNKYSWADAGVITAETTNHPFEVLIRPGKDRFTLPEDVWRALQLACANARLPIRQLGPDPALPEGVVSILYSRKPLGFWGSW